MVSISKGKCSRGILAMFVLVFSVVVSYAQQQKISTALREVISTGNFGNANKVISDESRQR